MPAPAASPLISLPAWQALGRHADAIRGVHLRDLFAKDPERAGRFSREAEGLFLDFSKNRITDETLSLLLDLARQSGLQERIAAMFSGEKINLTENRSVLHVALRAPATEKIFSDGVDACPKFTPYSTKCRPSRIVSAAATGKATPASASKP